MQLWYTVLAAGGECVTGLVSRSPEECKRRFIEAMERHYDASEVGTYVAAGSAVIAGYQTRQQARDADISTAKGAEYWRSVNDVDAEEVEY